MTGKANHSKAPAVLREGDSFEARESAWAALRAAFLEVDSALIFHLKTHYAIIFALREWEEGAGAQRRHVRQLLTARRGQRPSVWIDFSEACATMLGWAGYAVLQVRLARARGEGGAGGSGGTAP